MKLLIRGGRLIDPASGLDRIGDVAIAGARVIALGEVSRDFAPERTIDASGLVVAPGLVDLAARLREPGHEHEGMLESELAAAAAGGVTSLVCLPDTDPPLDEPGLVEMLKFRARKLSRCRLFPLGALTRGLAGETLTEMAELTEAGCVGFSQADVRDRQYADPAARAAVRGHLRLHGLVAAAGRLARQRRGRQRGGVDPPGPVGRAGGGRDRRPAHDLRVGARHRGARAPVPPVERRRRRTVAPRQGRGPAGHGRCQHQLAAADRCRHRLLQFRDAGDAAVAPAARPRRACRLRWPTARSTRWCRTTRRSAATRRPCPSAKPAGRDRARVAARPGPGLGRAAELGLAQSLAPHHQRAGARARAAIGSLGASAGRLVEGGVADVCIFDPAARWTVRADALLSQGKHTPFAFEISGFELAGRVQTTLVAGGWPSSEDRADAPAGRQWRLPARCWLHVGHGLAIVLGRFPSLDTDARQDYIQWWSAKVLRLLGITLHRHGTPRRGAKLLVANHVSWLDIAAIHAVAARGPLRGQGRCQALALRRPAGRWCGHAVHRAREEARRDAGGAPDGRGAEAGDTLAVFPRARPATGPRCCPSMPICCSRRWPRRRQSSRSCCAFTNPARPSAARSNSSARPAWCKACGAWAVRTGCACGWSGCRLTAAPMPTDGVWPRRCTT